MEEIWINSQLILMIGLLGIDITSFVIACILNDTIYTIVYNYCVV